MTHMIENRHGLLKDKEEFSELDTEYRSSISQIETLLNTNEQIHRRLISQTAELLNNTNRIVISLQELDSTVKKIDKFFTKLKSTITQVSLSSSSSSSSSNSASVLEISPSSTYSSDTNNKALNLPHVPTNLQDAISDLQLGENDASNQTIPSVPADLLDTIPDTLPDLQLNEIDYLTTFSPISPATSIISENLDTERLTLTPSISCDTSENREIRPLSESSDQNQRNGENSSVSHTNLQHFSTSGLPQSEPTMNNSRQDNDRITIADQNNDIEDSSKSSLNQDIQELKDSSVVDINDMRNCILPIISTDDGKKIITYTCKVCQESYKFKSHIVSHLKTVHRARRNSSRKCLFCGVVCNSIIAKKDHEKKEHLSDLEIKYAKDGKLICYCNFCGKNLIRICDGIRHLETVHSHAIDPKYKCSYCNKLYMSKKSRHDHIAKDHFSECIYDCPYCQVKFDDHTEYEKHKKKYHKGKIFPKMHRDPLYE